MYYLENKTDREKIAKTGAAWIRAKHTYKDRLETILQAMGFY
jgi:spore maturation protein CgeB